MNVAFQKIILKILKKRKISKKELNDNLEAALLNLIKEDKIVIENEKIYINNRKKEKTKSIASMMKIILNLKEIPYPYKKIYLIMKNEIENMVKIGKINIENGVYKVKYKERTPVELIINYYLKNEIQYNEKNFELYISEIIELAIKKLLQKGKIEINLNRDIYLNKGEYLYLEKSNHNFIKGGDFSDKKLFEFYDKKLEEMKKNGDIYIIKNNEYKNTFGKKPTNEEKSVIYDYIEENQTYNMEDFHEYILRKYKEKS